MKGEPIAYFNGKPVAWLVIQQRVIVFDDPDPPGKAELARRAGLRTCAKPGDPDYQSTLPLSAVDPPAAPQDTKV